MTELQQVRCVLWDWNGTLLDDLELCLEAHEALCRPRNITPLNREAYRETFTFPVKDYYEAVGFDFEEEPFDVPAAEWVEYYTSRVLDRADLHLGARETLQRVQDAGLRQNILSAHEHEALLEAVRHFGIADYFDEILGLGDFNAVSKVDLGRGWLENSKMNPREVVLVGDTLHDHEVAEEMGIGCVLIDQGHQSRRRLMQSGAPLLNNLGGVTELLGLA